MLSWKTSGQDDLIQGNVWAASRFWTSCNASSHTTLPEAEANSDALGTCEDLNNADHGEVRLWCARLGRTAIPASMRLMPRRPGMQTTWIDSLAAGILESTGHHGWKWNHACQCIKQISLLDRFRERDCNQEIRSHSPSPPTGLRLGATG